MSWNYPRLTSNTHWKLLFILLAEILLVVASLLIAIHCTWRSERWRLLNGNYLEWYLGLDRVWAAANCDALNEPRFHALCMSVLKNTFGSIREVRDFICGLRTADIKIEPEFVDEARVFYSSCYNMQEIYSISLAAFIMTIFVAILAAVVFILVLVLSYQKFSRNCTRIYWLSFSLQVISTLLSLIAFILYYAKMPDVLPRLFNYPDPVNPVLSIVQRVANSGGVGSGFYIAAILLMVDGIVTTLLLFWLPIAQKEVQIVKAKKKKNGERARLLKGAPEPMQSSFWAYMPEVFQPDVYVAEYGQPQLHGYAQAPAIATTYGGGYPSSYPPPSQYPASSAYPSYPYDQSYH